MNATRLLAAPAALAVATSAVLPMAASAATVNYVGPGLDLAAPANWSQQSWTVSDTLTVSSNNAAIPETGLTLASDLSASASLQFGRLPDRAVPVDFGGHALNTKLVLNTMHDDPGRFNPLLASGGWKAVSQITMNNHNACLHLTNGVFETAKAFATANGRWNCRLHILAGATLVATNIDDMVYCFESTHASVLDINGGIMKITGRTANVWWRQFVFSGATSKCSIMIRNGGAYIDETTLPQDYFMRNVSLLIDGGSYIATNSTIDTRNTIFAASGPFAVTNGTVRIAQFYTGPFQNSTYGFDNAQTECANDVRITFHDSEETFGFKAGRSGKGAGFVFSPMKKRSSLRLSGNSNAWRSHCLMLNGESNMVEVAGGTFAVTNILRVAAGIGCSLSFTGGASQIEDLLVDDTATNFTMSVAGDASIALGGFENKDAGTMTLRFAVPAGGWDAAPLSLSDSSRSGSLAGATFAFDMSSFAWPDDRARIPLILDEGGVLGQMSVAEFNAAQSAGLPIKPDGQPCKFATSADGKTLYLQVPGNPATIVFFR